MPTEPSPPAAPGPGLELRGVERIYRVGLRRRPHVALRGLDLEIERGKTVGFIGPNGSGKSTLLRLLAGVDRPTKGTVRVLGVPPHDRAARTRLAYLADGDPFPAELPARAALRLVARLRGHDGRTSRALAESSLDAVGLLARGGTRLGAFSRGMHRRFGLAQAFLGAPEVVLLDEPTAGLDAPGFDALARLMEQARERGATVVLASHIPSDLVEHCDEAVLLVDGAIRERDDARALLGDPERTEIIVTGGPDAGLRARAALDAAGVQVTSSSPARRSLAALYRRPEPPA